MWLWKIFFPVTICLFGCNHGSEFIVPPNDGKMRYFRGFETDEFHFKIKSDATNAKNVSYIYLLDNLNARTNYGRYMRISVRYDLHGTTWLNIYSSNSGLTASERTAKFRDKPDQEGFRGYWIRRQRHLLNGRLNRWEFGQEWDSVHPIMGLELKFPFFPQFFALEGFSTWKLEQILFRRPSSSFGFFSSADLSVVHMPTFFPPMANMIASQTDSSTSATPGSSTRQILKFLHHEISSPIPRTTKRSSAINRFPLSKNSLRHLKGSTSATKRVSSSLQLPKHQKLNHSRKLRVKTQINSLPRSKNSSIEMNLPNVTFPKVNTSPLTILGFTVPKITLPNVTFPKIDFPSVTLPSIKIPKITVPSVTFPKINIPTVTMPSVKIPKITLPNVTFPNIDFPSVTLPSIKIPKITLPNVTFPKINIPSVTMPSVKIPKITLPNVTFPKINIPSVTMPIITFPKITLPNVTFPKVNVRSATIPSIEFPKITLPNVTVPKIDIPSVTLPSVEFPKITWPNITFPKIDIPSVTLPSVEPSRITFPIIPLPNVTSSDFEIPIITLLPMLQSNVAPPNMD